MHSNGKIRLLNYFTYSLLPCFFWILVIFGFDEPYAAVLTVITALIHELGHLLAIQHYTAYKLIPSGRLDGMRIKCPANTSYGAKIIILSAGPLANLTFALLLYPFMHKSGYVDTFFYLNLATAISNLLPEEGYDGYGIMREILEYYSLSLFPLSICSFSVSVLLTFFSLFMIGRFGGGYWIFFVFFTSLMKKISKSKKEGIF